MQNLLLQIKIFGDNIRFHVSFSRYFFGLCTKSRGKHLFLNKFNISSVINLLTKITTTNIASSLCQLSIQYLDTLENKPKFNLRLLSCGGSSLSENYIKKAIEYFKCKFFTSYGMTECCGKIALSLVNKISDKSTINDIKLIKTSGRKFKYIEMKVVNSKNQQIKNNNLDVGEVVIKGDTVFNGYLNYDNKDVFTSDGWFKQAIWLK